MKKLILLLLFIPIISFGQSIDQEVELPALRLSDNFSKPYRVLKTTISDKSLFQQYYNNTKITLDYVIRYHLYTSIDLNSEKNQLISMDGTKFNLSSKNAAEIIHLTKLGWTSESIANEMNIKHATVRTIKTRAIKELRKNIGKLN